jgi:uncharacterized alpha-E superfamily protein
MAKQTSVSIPELTADLERLHQIATSINDELDTLMDGRHLPDSVVPNLNASRRAAQSLKTQLGASALLAEAAK